MNDRNDLPELASQLEDLFGRKNWRLLWQTYTLDRNWPEIAGREIAKQSRPAYIRNNILWIHVGSSVWMHHLQSTKPQLLDKVRQALPKLTVHDIRWVLQPVAAPGDGRQPGSRTEHIPDSEQARAFERMASTIENEECRAALCRLWRAYQKFQ
jgi:predicted nucleic acid-binding Zn ribbon protein